MRNLIRVLALIMAVSSLAAQQVQAQDRTGSSKRLVKIDEGTGDLVEIPQVQAQPIAQAQAASPIVIMNNQRSSQGTNQSAGQTAGLNASQSQIQDQPTNVIEDSPLTVSSSERRRRDRQALEIHTEQKIVEKLEEARIEDERARSERLFGGGFGSGKREQTVQVVQAAPVVVREEHKVNVKEEVRAALNEMKPSTNESETQHYVQGLVGVGSYPDAVNVRGNVATGVAVGMITADRIVAEGAFQYSQFDIEQMQVGYSYGVPPFKRLSQYNFQAAIKYQVLPGRIRPVVGAIAGYTYRSYADQQAYGVGVSTSNVSTNAFDVGALLGLDVQMTNSFSVGVDMRYMKNVSYRENSNYQTSFVYPRAGKPVEQLDYYLGSLTGRFTF